MLWAVPYGLIAIALPHLSPRYRPVRAWMAAGLVAASCALPALWGWHVEAKLRSAEREISRLAARGGDKRCRARQRGLYGSQMGLFVVGPETPGGVVTPADGAARGRGPAGR